MRRKLPDLYACPCCNRVPLAGDGCGCWNDVQVQENKRGQPTAYSVRRFPPVPVREADGVRVHPYEGPIILPLAERV